MTARLDLSPVRRWGILLAGGVLAHDVYAQAPILFRTRRQARKALRAAPAWVHAEALCRVTYDPSADVYLVGGRSR